MKLGPAAAPSFTSVKADIPGTAGSRPSPGRQSGGAADGAPLYRLLAWLSPGFPVGAFSYSHGLEAAVESGQVHDRLSLQRWARAAVLWGAGRIDADILRDAHRAAAAGDIAALAGANRRGLAYRATPELALETAGQGHAFFTTCRTAWPEPLLDRWAAVENEFCYPATVGAAAARAGISLGDALLAYLQALAANLVSAGLRLGVVGQTDGQHILAALEAEVTAGAEAAPARAPEEFGAATFAVDLASMAHEIQYTRLFRS